MQLPRKKYFCIRNILNSSSMQIHLQLLLHNMLLNNIFRICAEQQLENSKHTIIKGRSSIVYLNLVHFQNRNSWNQSKRMTSSDIANILIIDLNTTNHFH